MMAEVAGVANLKVEPQVLVPQVEVQYAPRGGRTVRLDRRPYSPRVDDALMGNKCRRDLRRAEALSTCGLGRARIAHRYRRRCKRCRSTRRRGRRCGCADVADVDIVPDAERNQARERLAAARYHVQREDRDLGSSWPAKSKRRFATVSFDREYHPEFLGEYAARQNRRRLYLAVPPRCSPALHPALRRFSAPGG